MSSPFKFLDAYTQEDAEVFFGRAAETEQLYRLIGETDIVLVYGQSGTGKTSLIQCGLANRIRQTDWHPLWVRRKSDINASLTQEIHASAVTPIEDGATTVDALRSIYLDHLRPTYLIFDQFEELFVLGTAEEQEAFYQTIRQILASDLSCKIIVSLREEYLAQLDRFEQLVPNLFNKRLRVELMSNAAIERVITGTCGAHGIELENGDDTARLITDKLSDGGKTYVQLAYLQVYLDSLYNQAASGGHSEPVVFTDAAIEQTGQLGDVMSDFLDQRIRAIESELHAKHPSLAKGSVQLLLEEFVSVEGTKQPTTREELVARMPISESWVDDALASLQSSRVLREGDERYELAHDALAARIMETRSDERKAILQVRKIVRDGLAKYQQTSKASNFLPRDEIAIILRAQGQTDPITKQPLLQLDAAETDYLSNSKKSRRWQRVRQFSAWGAMAAIVLGLLGIVILISEDAYHRDQETLMEQQAVRYRTNDSNDNMAYQSYLYLLDNEDPNVQQARLAMLQYALINNSNRDYPSGPQESERDFWNDLFKFTKLMESQNYTEAGQQLDTIADEQKKKLAENPNDWDARIRYKAALLRQFHQSSWPARAEFGRLLVQTMTFKDGFDPVDYTYDVEIICTLLKSEGAFTDQECKGVTILDPADLPFELPENVGEAAAAGQPGPEEAPPSLPSA